MEEIEKPDSQSSPETKSKFNELINSVLDSAIKAAPKVSEELVIDVAREALGLSKKSDLRKGSKAFYWSTFLKEVVPTLVWGSVAVLAIYTFFIVLWRYLGI